MKDEFYIGWEAKSAPGPARTTRRLVVAMHLLALVLAAGLAAAQRLIGVSVFEFGEIKTFSGRLVLNACPCLLVPRPGATDPANATSTYYLVAPFKHGLDRAKLAALDGQPVTLQGTLIYRGNQTMVEAIPETIKPASAASPSFPALPDRSLGRQTLRGEIVDSKCYFGVMNPGNLLPHRGCAIRCISGGIPPVLLVQAKDQPPVYLLLVSASGGPVNQQVLDLVAEPVEITGEVIRQNGLLTLRADPATYRRVN